MNPDSPLEPWLDPAVEARVVAVVLGEASAFEVAEVGRLLAEFPELASFARRIRAVHGLLGEDFSHRETDWKLPPEKRATVLEAIGSNPAGSTALSGPVRPAKPKRRLWLRGIQLTAIAASVLLGAWVGARFLFFPGSARIVGQNQQSLAILDGNLQVQEQRVREARLKTDKAMKDCGIIDIGRASGNGRTGEGDEGSASMILRGGSAGGSGGGGFASSSPADFGERSALPSSGINSKVAASKPAPPALKKESSGKSGSGPQSPATDIGGIAAIPATQAEFLEKAKGMGVQGKGKGMGVQGKGKGMGPSKRIASSSTTSSFTLPDADGNEDKRIADASARELGYPVVVAKAKSVEVRQSNATELDGESLITRHDAVLGDVVATEETEGRKVAVNNDELGRVAGDREWKLEGAKQEPKVEVVREFFDDALAAAEPANRPRSGTETAAGNRSTAFPVTPATPTEFEPPEIPADSGQLANSKDEGNASLVMKGKRSMFEQTQEVETLRAQISSLQDLEGGDFIRKAATLGIQDATLNRFYPQYNELVLKERQLAESGLAENHPERRAIRNQLDSVQSLLTKTVHDVKETLGLQLQHAEGKMEATGAPKPSKASPPARPAPTLESGDTAMDPVSTFSLNVSDASFQVGAQALLANGVLPEPSGVRTEDYVNAMDYGDALPGRGEAVSAVLQQAAHPFLPGRNMVRIGVRTAAAGRSEAQPLCLTLLLDQSGSMERPDRAEAVQHAVRELTGLLKPQDTVTVIGFARAPRLLAERLTGGKLAELPQLVREAAPEGGTNLDLALDLAARAALQQFNPAAQNRVVLITDGAANLGSIDPEAMGRRVESLRRQRLAFDACGVGTDDLDDAMLEAMTRKGDGRYIVLGGKDDDHSLGKELAGAFRPAARNVKIQVRFNPDRVGKFQLLGFEKHLLKEQDFRDDTVDAAELAAAEQGNALYQVEMKSDGSGETGDIAVRFRDTATGQMVERHWTIPYDPATPPLAAARPPMQLAVTAGLLAESLKGSPIGNLVRLEELNDVQNNLRRFFPDDQKVATLLQMVARTRSLQGK